MTLSNTYDGAFFAEWLKTLLAVLNALDEKHLRELPALVSQYSFQAFSWLIVLEGCEKSYMNFLTEKIRYGKLIQFLMIIT